MYAPIGKGHPSILFIPRNTFLANLNNTVMKQCYSWPLTSAVRKTLLLLVVLLGASYVTNAQIYWVSLSGPAEAPPNAYPGIGKALVTIDATANTMRVQVNFSGLLAGVTASHIHSATTVAGTGTAGVATAVPTFPGFPLTVTSGT